MAADRYFVDSTPVLDLFPSSSKKKNSNIDYYREREAKARAGITELQLADIEDRKMKDAEHASSKPTSFRRMTQTRNRAAALDILNNIYGGDPVLTAFLTAIKHTR